MDSQNNIVVKSNKLIEARYSLNLNEQKIILYAISKLDREQEKFNILSFKVTEFTDLIDTTKKRYTEFKEIAKNLISKRITIDTSEKELITTWLSSMEYKKEKAIVELEFSEKLIPYLLQLKEQFTKYQLKNILHFKNKYSIRVYELLKQYQNIGKRQFEIEELKKFLGCEDKYKDFRNFKRAILDEVEKEINDYTDITISYEKIAEGRKVVAIKYTIDSKQKEEDLIIEELYSKEEIDSIRIKSGLDNNRFNNKQIMELYTIAVQQTDNMEIDPFEYIRLNYQNMIQKGAVKSPFAYLKKSLEQDFAKAKNQLKFKFDVDEDKIRELKDQIDRADNSLVRQILQKELDALLN